MSAYLTLEQAAERAVTSPATVRYWIQLGKLPAYKPGRRVLVRSADLDALIESSAIGVVRAERAKRARASARSKGRPA